MKILYFLFFIFANIGYAARPFITTNTPELMAHEGVTSEVAVWEDARRISTKSGNYEWWYFDVNLDDGSKFVAVFATKDAAFPMFPLTPYLALSWTAPDGTTITEKIKIKKKDFAASTEYCNVKMGNSRVTGALTTYQLKIVGEKIQANLIFKRIAPSWRPGAGKVYFDKKLKKFMGWVVPMPSAKVNGDITINGEKMAVSGAGYHDHNWGNYPILLVCDYWIWGRAHADGHTILYFQSVGTRRWGKKPLSLFMLASEDRLLISNPTEYEVTTGPLIKDDVKYGRMYPDWLEIRAKEGDVSVNLILNNSTVMERIDRISAAIGTNKTLNWLLRSVFKFNPWYLRLEADLEAEITLENGEIRNLQGASIYELQLIGKAKELAP